MSSATIQSIKALCLRNSLYLKQLTVRSIPSSDRPSFVARGIANHFQEYMDTRISRRVALRASLKRAYPYIAHRSLSSYRTWKRQYMETMKRELGDMAPGALGVQPTLDVVERAWLDELDALADPDARAAETVQRAKMREALLVVDFVIRDNVGPPEIEVEV